MTTVAVTGSASGLGRATKHLLEADGVRVIGVDVAHADVIADLSSVAGRAAAAEGIAIACGGVLDGFVGYAGVGPTVSDIQLLTSVNYFGQIELLAAIKPLLLAASRPAVVVVSSVASMVSATDADSVAAMVAGDEPTALKLTARHADAAVAYSSSKQAALHVGRQLALDWIGEGVRVNILAPGCAKTPMTDDALADPEMGPLMQGMPVPIGAWAEPEEIAEAARWLLSDSSRYVVGSVLVVDGGIYALTHPALV